MLRRHKRKRLTFIAKRLARFFAHHFEKYALDGRLTVPRSVPLELSIPRRERSAFDLMRILLRFGEYA